MARRNTGDYEAVQERRQVEVPLAVVGCDFRTAPTSYRGVLVTSAEERGELFAAIQRMDPGAGLLVLETCNRVEWVVSTEEPRWMAELLKAQMLSRWCTGLEAEGELPDVNVFLGRDAAAHIFRVVAGMESLAAGEAEIAGQFQRALQRALTEHTTSRILNGLGRFTGGMAKTAMRSGFRSGHSRGIHVLAGLFLEKRLQDRKRRPRAAVVGMGEIGRKTADFIEQSVGWEVVRVNRTIASQHVGVWRPLAELAEISAQVDALVVASGARHPVVKRETLSLDIRQEPLLIMDLGIPRQVEPELDGVERVRYHDVDSLLEVNGDSREAEGRAQMEDAIGKQVARFRRFCLERELIVLLHRAQQKRFDMLGETLNAFVDRRLNGVLDEAGRAAVIAAMKELVRDYSSDVFESVHEALDDQWGAE